MAYTCFSMFFRIFWCASFFQNLHRKHFLLIPRRPSRQKITRMCQQFWIPTLGRPLHERFVFPEPCVSGCKSLSVVLPFFLPSFLLPSPLSPPPLPIVPAPPSVRLRSRDSHRTHFATKHFFYLCLCPTTSLRLSTIHLCPRTQVWVVNNICVPIHEFR